MVTPVKLVDEMKGKDPRDILEIIKQHCLKTKPVSHTISLITTIAIA